MLVLYFHVNFVFQYICKVAAKNKSEMWIMHFVKISKKTFLKEPKANFPPLCLEMNHAILSAFSYLYINRI